MLCSPKVLNTSAEIVRILSIDMRERYGYGRVSSMIGWMGADWAHATRFGVSRTRHTHTHSHRTQQLFTFKCWHHIRVSLVCGCPIHIDTDRNMDAGCLLWLTCGDSRSDDDVRMYVRELFIIVFCCVVCWSLRLGVRVQNWVWYGEWGEHTSECGWWGERGGGCKWQSSIEWCSLLVKHPLMAELNQKH